MPSVYKYAGDIGLSVIYKHIAVARLGIPLTFRSEIEQIHCQRARFNAFQMSRERRLQRN